jgi:hypothetical protein
MRSNKYVYMDNPFIFHICQSNVSLILSTKSQHSSCSWNEQYEVVCVSRTYYIARNIRRIVVQSLALAGAQVYTVNFNYSDLTFKADSSAYMTGDVL